jgi:hypothetical protein
VLQGRATGSTWALRMRAFMQSTLFAWGRFIRTCWPGILFVAALLTFLLCIPLKDVRIEVDIVKLWVESEFFFFV